MKYVLMGFLMLIAYNSARDVVKFLKCSDPESDIKALVVACVSAISLWFTYYVYYAIV